MLVNQIRNIMTTMELNLRKQCFTEFILSMSEEEFTELRIMQKLYSKGSLHLKVNRTLGHRLLMK